jgi:hypothetical protein
MERQKKVTLVLAAIAVLTGLILWLPGISRAGNLEPSGPPGPTMKTLEEIPPTWSRKLPASTRFQLVLDDQAVLDKETGLVWERSPATATIHWFDACYECLNKAVGGRKGWRLPTVEELASLVDTSAESAPPLPSGHPFNNVQPSYYWSSTTSAGDPNLAWLVSLSLGDVYGLDKSSTCNVWCVRGGQGHDSY